MNITIQSRSFRPRNVTPRAVKRKGFTRPKDSVFGFVAELLLLAAVIAPMAWSGGYVIGSIINSCVGDCPKDVQ